MGKTKCSELLFTEQLLSECEKAVTNQKPSQLTVIQYNSMSNEERSHLNNRIQQCALKARGSLPNEHGLFCLVLGHLLKNAHRYFQLDCPSDIQKQILQSKTFCDQKSEQVVEQFKETNKKLRMVGELKCKNRVKEQQRIVNELKGDYHSLRNLSSISGISLKTVHNWCSVPRHKVHKGSELSHLR